MNVYFLGPAGSFSALLAEQKFKGLPVSLHPCSSFNEILQAVHGDQKAIGVLPIENSITSNVHENIDSLFAKELFIVGEAYLEVQLHVLGLQGASLDTSSTIYSHPKALQQCSNWIESQGMKTIPCKSTSEAKDRVLELADPSALLIGARALRNDEIVLLKENVGNVEKNTTRFVFVSHDKSAIKHDKADKVSLTFKTPHRPGSLAFVLGELAAIDINLTKIMSQPIPGSDFEYKFWIDLEAEPEKIHEALALIEKSTPEHTIIGMYTRGTRYPS